MTTAGFKAIAHNVPGISRRLVLGPGLSGIRITYRVCLGERAKCVQHFLCHGVAFDKSGEGLRRKHGGGWVCVRGMKIAATGGGG